MSSSSKNLPSNGDARLPLSNKGASLNPNAAEFVPSALRYPSFKIKNADVVKTEAPGASNVSNHSDDEAHQYWRCQLPDDITPDFNATSEDDLSLSRLSLHDAIKAPVFSMTNVQNILGKLPENSLQGSEQKSKILKVNFSGHHTSRDYSSTSLLHSRSSNLNDSWHLTIPRDDAQYSGDPGFPKDLLDGHSASESMMMEHVEFLSSQFPDLALESLAEAYYANGCDLNLTIEMITQLELNVDAGHKRRMSPKAFSSPSLNDIDFHLLPENGNGLPKLGVREPLQPEGFSLFRSPSFSGDLLGSRDFIPSRSQDGLTDTAKIGPIRNPQLLMGPHNIHGKAHLGKSPMNYSVAPVYADVKEEAEELTRLRSAFYEQQREKQAYPMGSKEVGAKGHIYNFQMKDVQEKYKELMYPQRGQNPLIDLHGLHVNEAIHVLKHELSILRRTAKSAGRRLQVLVCVGVDSPARSPRPPSRLPAVVQQYLLHENLHFSEDQPGFLRVVIC